MTYLQNLVQPPQSKKWKKQITSPISGSPAHSLFAKFQSFIFATDVDIKLLNFFVGRFQRFAVKLPRCRLSAATKSEAGVSGKCSAPPSG